MDSTDLTLSGDNPPLTDQEQEFILYYAETLNKTQSYKRAFPGSDKDTNIIRKVSVLLSRPDIKQRINELVSANVDAEVAKSPSLLLKMIERNLEFDPADYYRDDGEIIPLSELSLEKRLLIQNISKQINNRTGDVILSYELPSKQKMIERLDSLVALITKVKALQGDTFDDEAEARKKRDEIFGKEVEDIVEEIEPIKRGRGRPRKHPKKEKKIDKQE